MFPYAIYSIIADYAKENKLLNWIDESKLDWRSLSVNKAAIHLLENNLYLTDEDLLSRNPAAIHLLEKNPDKIDWDSLSSNDHAIHILEKNPDKINWIFLSMSQVIFRYNKDEIYQMLINIKI